MKMQINTTAKSVTCCRQFPAHHQGINLMNMYQERKSGGAVMHASTTIRLVVCSPSRTLRIERDLLTPFYKHIVQDPGPYNTKIHYNSIYNHRHISIPKPGTSNIGI